MSEFTPKNFSGLTEAYASIYNNSNKQEVLNEGKVEQETIFEKIEIDTDALYEAMVQYLVTEGYADTEKQAKNMLPHLSEQYLQNIAGNIVMTEQFELCLNSLLEEGYDLNSYSFEELFERYLDTMSNTLNEGYADAMDAGVDPITGALVTGLGAVASGAKYVSDMQQRNAARQLEKAGQLYASVIKRSGKKVNLKTSKSPSPATPSQPTPSGGPTGPSGGPSGPSGGGGPSGPTGPGGGGPKGPNWMQRFLSGVQKDRSTIQPKPTKPPGTGPDWASKAGQVASAVGRRMLKPGLGVLGLHVGTGGASTEIMGDVLKGTRSMGPGYKQLKRNISGYMQPEPEPAPPTNPSQRPLRRDNNGKIKGLGQG